MKKSWWNGKVAYQIYPKSFCDANGDGSVNIADVALICRYIMGEAQLSADARELCDMNGDGSINVTDAVLVCMKVAGN